MANGSAVPNPRSEPHAALEGALSAERVALGLERCPWCGQTISRDEFLRIQTRIREEERKRLAAAETELRKEFAGKEANIRKKALEEAEKKAKSDRTEIDRRHKEEISKVRELEAKERDKALVKQRAEFNRHLETSQRKVKDLERQLQQKTANEAGDGAEIDLFEALREAFPDDRITRVGKGQRGGDILEEILQKGETCGRILIDSKNRQAWQNLFVTKLREDQVEAQADHAILSTTVFPSGKKELFVQDDVIVVTPARVVPIIELLRAAVVKLHSLGLSGQERADKMARLYAFMTSEKYAQLYAEAGRLIDDILEVDVKEQQEHQKVWKTRGGFATRLKNVMRRIDTEVSAILEGTE